MKANNLWKWGAAGALVALAGCGNAPTATGTSGTGSTQLKGRIIGDGSSTVFPITEAVAEEFTREHPGVQVPVGISGTGGGFKKLIAGDTVLQDASRPIKDKEIEAMAAKKREFIELPVAYDGLSIVVHPKNTWATCLTVAELKKIWQPGSKVKNWSQVRAGFPDKPLKLYGAGTDSGTFDYFTEAINGKEGASRSDYTASEDDNTLVQGVSRDVNALGYFGVAYYQENSSKLKLVAVDNGGGCVEPTAEAVNTGKYKPLSRPLFLYIERKAADRPEVQEFVRFYLSQAKELVTSVGYVPLPDNLYEAVLARFETRTIGSVYADKAAHDATLETLYGAK
ncbi:MAG TPA: PstS family phosphate ABC transporter substrate-binding protein [Abditibacteriaceae bacterium]|nr:PstS family phosphate ABC transporter substrate-binding protein [Abditibacteriaceae bacterium]